MSENSLPTTPGVVYKAIDGFPGYAVGDDGSVWSTNGRWSKGQWRRLNGWTQNAAQVLVTLTRNGVETHHLVHRLVLEAFVGPCPEGMLCRHFPDRDPTNNKLSNLQWGTPKENERDKQFHGTDMRGERHHRAKLSTQNVREILTRFSNGERQASLAREYGVTRHMVWRIVARKSWKHIE